MSLKTLRILVTAAMLLALFVTMLGAYTRLTDAGLGCPDWPGCYGQMILPNDPLNLGKAQNLFPNSPIETGKAWTEMTHRYFAGTLGLLIFLIGIYVLVKSERRMQKLLAAGLMALVVFQALLGMWTVTLKLLPIVVIGHLLGGILIFSGLTLLRVQLSTIGTWDFNPWHKWVMVAVFVIMAQIGVGGLVSANYAGLACVGFPKCNGQWLPSVDTKGMKIIKVGVNYTANFTATPAKIIIQYIHRFVGLTLSSFVMMLSILIMTVARPLTLRILAGIWLFLIISQMTLGILNVTLLMPLWSTVLHNGCAALLLATAIILTWVTRKRPSYAEL